MVIDRRKFESSLCKKGFVKDGGDHIFFRHMVDGKYSSVYTKVSHTKKLKDISRDLLTLIRKQLRLDTNQEVSDLVECPLSEEGYNEILREKGIF